MARSKHRDDTFRGAAQRWVDVWAAGRVTVEPHGQVSRAADGGAYVEALIWVPEDEADKEAKP